MDMPYENKHTQQLELFSFKDIYYLLTHDVGLRLTPRYSDITEGSTGDAIPLSHVGGAQDSIQFATLSAVLRHETDLEDAQRRQYRQTLLQIFEKYAGRQHDKLDYTPNLILAYADLLKIGDVKIDATTAERLLPLNEEKLLIKLYHMSGGALFPSVIFDQKSQYYPNLPSLRLHLTSDFNQLLKKRLKINCSFYASSGSMYYLLLTSTAMRYTYSYDLDAYPLGKTGRAAFTPQEVISHHTVGGENPEDSLRLIWAWLKQQCTHSAAQQLDTSPSYWKKCVRFCQDHKETLVLAGGLGLFVGGLGIKMLRQADYSEASMPSLMEL